MNVSAVAAGLSGLVLWATYTDFRYRIISNRLTIGGAAAGLVWHGASGGTGGLLDSLAGLAAGFALMLALHLFGALGAGDVKLFAAIGAIGGLAFVWSCSLYAIVYAGLIGAVMLVMRKGRIFDLFAVLLNLIWFRSLQPIKDLRKRNDLLTFPFMAAVVPAVITAAWEHWL